MYYFKENDSVIEKYKIVFNEERIKELRHEIIDNCSNIIHNEKRTTLPEMFKEDKLKYRNLHTKQIGIREYQDGPDHIEYLVTFDEYIFPEVVKLIDNMLLGDTNSTLKIVAYHTKTVIDIDKLIAIKSDELDKIDNLNIKAKRQKLNELESLLEEKELNKNQKSIDYYINELKSEINFVLVDTIDKETVERVNNFYRKLVK